MPGLQSQSLGVVKKLSSEEMFTERYNVFISTSDQAKIVLVTGFLTHQEEIQIHDSQTIQSFQKAELGRFGTQRVSQKTQTKYKGQGRG